MKEIHSENENQDEHGAQHLHNKSNCNSNSLNGIADGRPTSSARLRRSNTEASVGNSTINSDDAQQYPLITPFERLSQELSSDQRVLKEVTLGRRIAFYRIRGEIGAGNFSQVKLGIHALTKGNSAMLICCASVA